MKKVRYKALMIVFLTTIFASCGRQQNNDEGIISSESNNSEAVIGTVGHGLKENSSDEDYITYNGEELCLEYSICASGVKDKGIGFMIYIDGIPQQYRVDGTSEYQYMHVFYPEDNAEQTVLFGLNPNVGEKGAELELCVASVFCPDYVPDMNSSKGYGIYHDMVESIYTICYLESPTRNISSESGVRVTEICKASEKREDTEEATDFSYKFYIDDTDVSLGNYYNIGDKEQLKLNLEISGVDGAAYVCNFYIDHTPCLIDNPIYIETKTGIQTDIEVVLDATDLEGGNTLYAVMVPRNVVQMSEQSIRLQKTSSVFLIREMEDDISKNEEIESEQQIDETIETETTEEQTENPEAIINAPTEIPTESEESTENGQPTEEVDVTDDGTKKQSEQTAYMGTKGLDIYYAGEGKCILLSDEAELVDIATLTSLKKSDNLEQNVSLYDISYREVLRYPEGYYIFGISSDYESIKIINFDRDLKFKSLTSFSDTQADQKNIKYFKLYDSGNKLLYGLWGGLYTYDFQTKETQKLLDKNLYVDSCDVSLDGKTVYFSADEYVDDTYNARLFGAIDLDTKEVTYNAEDHLWGKLWCYGEQVLVEEADIYGKELEHIVMRRDADGNIHIFPFTDKKEYTHIETSTEGNYYSTSTVVKGEGFYVRIYESKNGKMIREIPMLYSEYGEKFRLSNVLICEKEKKIIFSVHYGYAEEWQSYLISMDL